MGKAKVLIIDDEEDIVELLSYTLKRDGYIVRTANSGEEGLKVAREEKPDLILLDVMLPGTDGFEICKILRSDEKLKETLIIMLTAKTEDADVVLGLEIGADDYMVKPFSPRIVSAKIKSLIGRKNDIKVKTNSLEIDQLKIDPGKFLVTIAQKPIDLTNTEFKLLHALVRHRGYVLSRYQIVDRVHGEDYAATDRAVDVQIVGLRRKLGEYGNYIETVRGVGYKFKE